MSIRFKFRSSVNFDTLDIGDRASITVGELRTKILKGKTSQQQQQGFDLVFSDAVSGLEFKGDNGQISSGTSVIVRRVPAGTLPPAVPAIQVVKDVGLKEACNLKPPNEPLDEFDDLGADLCPVPESNFPDFNLELGKNDLMDNAKDEVAGIRQESLKHAPSDLTGDEKNILPRFEQQIISNKLPTSNFSAEQFTNLPIEMKCPLCNTFFKEAVMIPCCQHSFCQNCIRQVLIEKGRCPKCFSSKCNVEDLLPNLSLRQAIEHFLEAEMLDTGLQNAMQKYVPDGESGIQTKDFSCAVSVVQKDVELPQSSSATGKGSSQVYMNTYCEPQRQRNVLSGTTGNRDLKSSLPSQNVNQRDGISGYPRHNDMQRGPEDFALSVDFQGENQPVIPPANAHREADTNSKRQGGLWVDSGGGDRNFPGHGGYRKGVRNCYTCGSPDHLMRDCPMSHPNPMFQPGNGAFHGGMPGYAQPYWNGPSLPPPFRPYGNMYGNPGMMPFNASMVPVSPSFAPSPYFPSMGGRLPGPGVNMRMGNMGPPRHPEHFRLQHCENKRKLSNEDLGRENNSDEDDDDDDSPEHYRHHIPKRSDDDDSLEHYRHHSPKRSHDHRLQKEDKPSLTHSDDSFARRSGGKSHHDKFSHAESQNVDERHDKPPRPSYSGRDRRQPSHGERSSSGKEDASRSSEGGHKHHHHGESKKHHERKAHYDSDSSYDHHSAQKSTRKRVELDVRGSHKSGYEHSPPAADRKRGYKERDTGHDFSRRTGKHSRDEPRDDRWHKDDEDHRDEYRHHKRRAH